MPKKARPIWEKIIEHSVLDEQTGCIHWTGTQAGLGVGYGSVYFNGKSQFVHRVVFQLCNPKVEISELNVNHHCDNPKCINAKHLYAGTQSENVLDTVRRGRHARAASRGTKNPIAKLKEEQIPEIRARLEQGEYTTSLAKEFGVHPATIWCIKKRGTWSHSK